MLFFKLTSKASFCQLAWWPYGIVVNDFLETKAVQENCQWISQGHKGQLSTLAIKYICQLCWFWTQLYRNIVNICIKAILEEFQLYSRSSQPYLTIVNLFWKLCFTRTLSMKISWLYGTFVNAIVRLGLVWLG